MHLDSDLEDAESHVTRYKPEGLDALCRSTKFTRKELQILYRGFKQVAYRTIQSDSYFEFRKSLNQI